MPASRPTLPTASHRRPRAHRRAAAALAVSALLALSAGCGAGGGLGLAILTVGGTAALGNPVPGAKVLLVDVKGTTVSTTTDGTGHYEVSVEGLTPPFLIQVVPTSGAPFFTVAKGSGIANADPYSNLLLETIYKVTSTTPAAELALLTSTTTTAGDIPSAGQVAALQDLFERMLAGWLQKNNVDPASWTLLETHFEANGQGYDALLDSTSVVGSDVTIQDGTTTQTSSVTADAQGNVAVDTTVTTAQGTTQTHDTILVAGTSAAQTAIDRVNDTLQQLAATANQQGNQLADTDILAFFDVDHLHEGFTQLVQAGRTADFLRGHAVQLSLARVTAFNSQTSPTLVTADLLITLATTGGYSRSTAYDLTFNFNSNLNRFLVFGDQRPAEIDVSLIRDVSIDSNGTTSSTNLEVVVQALKGEVLSATVTGGAFGTTSATSLTGPSPSVDSYTPKPSQASTVTLQLELFKAGLVLGGASGWSPATIYSVAVTPKIGATTTYDLLAEGVEGEMITGFEVVAVGSTSSTHSRSQVIGHTVTVSWNLPVGYDLDSISLEAEVTDGGGKRARIVASPDLIAATATSATIAIPTDVPGGTTVTSVQIRADFLGTNREGSSVLYDFDQP